MPPITLLDLPVLPVDRDFACGTNLVHEAYLKNRKAIASVSDLRVHLAKWRNLWLLGLNREEVPEPVSLTDDQCELIVKWLSVPLAEQPALNRDPLPLEVRIWACVMAPGPLVRAFEVAHHYKVGSDLGLVRLYLDPYPELDDELR